MSAGVEVLLVHRVGPIAADATAVERAMTVGAETLDRALEARVGAGRPTPAALGDPSSAGVLLTCDDGHRSFAEVVVPLLERHRVHAILFVTTGFASGELCSYEQRLAYWLAESGGGEAQSDARYRELRDPLRDASASSREAALEQLGATRWPPCERYLSWSELRELARHPLVTIGAHGKRHTLLSAQRPWQAWAEIHGSRRELRAQLATPIRWFAYPYGGQRSITRRLVALAGFGGAFTTCAGRVAVGGDRFALPRIELLEETEA